MTTKKKTPTPGEELVASILVDMADNNLAPDSREIELLEKASATTNKIAALEMAVAEVGMTFVDKDGVTRPSPLLAEIRHLTLVLTRCLNGIQLDPDKAERTRRKAVQARQVGLHAVAAIFAELSLARTVTKGGAAWLARSTAR